MGCISPMSTESQGQSSPQQTKVLRTISDGLIIVADLGVGGGNEAEFSRPKGYAQLYQQRSIKTHAK